MRLLAFAFTIVFVWTGPNRERAVNFRIIACAIKFLRGHVHMRVVIAEKYFFSVNTGRFSDIQSSLESLDCVLKGSGIFSFTPIILIEQ